MSYNYYYYYYYYYYLYYFFSVDIDILEFFEIFFRLLRWSALYGVNDSFADRPYGTIFSLYCTSFSLCILFEAIKL